jgi:hypothetical protein
MNDDDERIVSCRNRYIENEQNTIIAFSIARSNDTSDEYGDDRRR